ncbi:MAG: hypothetical protein Q9178_005299 [Gyalolechia marmorata]
MEPIAVLGIVANVVQLVDAAGKAFTICREIYILGETIEDSRVAFTSKQLQQSCDELKKSLNQGNSSAQATSRNNDLNLAATKYFQTAQDLQAELHSLRTAPGSGLRVTIKATWFKKKKAKKIGKLKLALNEYEKTLDSTLLVDVRQTLDTLGTKQESQSKTIVQQLSNVSADLQSCQSNLANRFRSEIDRHIAASEAQHVVTREHVNAHVTRTMQGLSLSQEERVKNLEKQQQTQRRCDQFVSSFWFSEMHARMNDVEESHADTFQWIFEDDDATRPWDSFSHWLREGTAVYWINGKAGSGKIRGIRSEDSFDDLLQRIKQLPSRIHQLYLQMWNRLNEDKRQYQEEAATYFSYKARESECNSLVELSLFELLVALDPQLQNSIVNDFKPQDPLCLARQCEALRPRVLTRTAGLLEFVEDVGEKKRYRSQEPTKTSALAGNLNYTNDLGRCQSKQNCQSTSDENDFTGGMPQAKPSGSGDSLDGDPLATHYHLKLRYLHRTARDFLVDTEDGRKLSGRPRDLPIAISSNLLRAQMVSLLQGFIDFNQVEVSDFMDNIKQHCEEQPDAGYETELLIALDGFAKLSVLVMTQKTTSVTALFGTTSTLGLSVAQLIMDLRKYIDFFFDSPPPFDIEPSTRVLLMRTADSDGLANFLSLFKEDSSYFGQSLDRVLFDCNSPGWSYQASVQEYLSRRNEIESRSPGVDIRQWLSEHSAMLDREEELTDISGLSPEILGDDWFV